MQGQIWKFYQKSIDAARVVVKCYLFSVSMVFCRARGTEVVTEALHEAGNFNVNHGGLIQRFTHSAHDPNSHTFQCN